MINKSMASHSIFNGYRTNPRITGLTVHIILGDDGAAVTGWHTY